VRPKITIFRMLAVGLLLINAEHTRAEGGCPQGMLPFRFAPNQPPTCVWSGGRGNRAPSPPAPQWEDRWGAIATDGAKGILSIASDQLSERDATAVVMNDCRERGGTNCKLKVAYLNQCGVVVQGDGGFSVASERTLDAAIADGMKLCQDPGWPNCSVTHSSCSWPARIR